MGGVSDRFFFLIPKKRFLRETSAPTPFFRTHSQTTHKKMSQQQLRFFSRVRKENQRRGQSLDNHPGLGYSPTSRNGNTRRRRRGLKRDFATMAGEQLFPFEEAPEVPKQQRRSRSDSNFDEDATFGELGLGGGEPTLCMNAANEEKLFEDFLLANPGFTTIDELRMMSEHDEFQWWQFEELTISELLDCMTGLVQRYRERAAEDGLPPI